MRNLVLSICFILIAVTGYASVNDAPHNATNYIACNDCHSYSLWWHYSPSTNNPDLPHDEIVTFVCLNCHGPESSLDARSHSSNSMGTTTDEWYWSRSCTDCHDPHFQRQLDWLKENPALAGILYLVTGKVESGSISYNQDEHSTTFSYNSANSTREEWLDPYSWSVKTEADRGLILVVSSENQDSSYEINSVTGEPITKGGADGSGTMVVQGQINSDMDGANFGVIYGQLIKSEVNQLPVKFFGPNDPNYSFIDTSDPVEGVQSTEGICQVCHTATEFYNPYPNTHPSSRPCTECHSHEIGFAHGLNSSGGCGTSGCHDSGKHSEHLDILIECVSCHELTNLRDQSDNILFADELKLEATNVCDACHQDATGNLVAGEKDGWSDPVFDLNCSGCHAVAPNTGSHTTHLSITDCGSCHDGTVSGSTAPVQHIDQNIDVYNISPADLGYPADKAIGSAYTSCANMYCHSTGTSVNTGVISASTSAVWGSDPLSCDSCHGFGPDYPNGSPKSNSHQAHSTNCQLCHAATTTTGTSITDLTKHVNGTYDLLAGSGASFTYSAGTCSNISCHQGSSADWGGGSLSCDSCHGFGPDYPNGSPKSNSHQAHSTSCQFCHAATTTTGTSITNPAKHGNETYDLLAGSGASFTYSTGTCSNISCHQGGNAEWGSTTLSFDCDSCHGYPPVPGDGLNINERFDGGKGAHVTLSYNSSTGVEGGHILVTGDLYPVNDIYGDESGGYYECSKCHFGGAHGNGTVDVQVRTDSWGKPVPWGNYDRPDGFNQESALPAYQGLPGDVMTPKTCSNINCHSGTATPRWSCPGGE